MKKIGIVAVLVFLVITLCNSCIGFRTKHLKEKNPTSYVFHAPLTVLRDRIVKDFTKSRSEGINDLISVQEISKMQWIIKDVNNFKNTEKYQRVFEKPENILDLYLTPANNPAVSNSKVYKKFWKSLEYSAEFQLHMTSINEGETKIEVITNNPEVLYFGFNIFKTGHSYVYFKEVEPTTIEEYEILLRIGNLAGEKDMPSLKLPE